jgi:hypothetical protein
VERTAEVFPAVVAKVRKLAGVLGRAVRGNEGTREHGYEGRSGRSDVPTFQRSAGDSP